jgi:predicted transcriptional regulator
LTFKKVIEILEADVILDKGLKDLEILSVCSSDLLSDLLHFAKKPHAILITGITNTHVVRTAEIADIIAIAFVLNKKPEKDTIEMARQKGIPLIVTRFSRFTACGRLFMEGLRSCTEDGI